MAIDIPDTATEVSQKAKVDVKRQLSQSDPFLRRSYLGAIITSIANRVFEFYLALRDAEAEANPFTAVRNLSLWATIWGINRLTGSSASGTIWVDSVASGSGVTIPVNTRFTSSDGSVYISSADAILVANTFPVTITQTGGVATGVVSGGHGLASNAIITITGANEAGYNVVDATITVVNETDFEFAVPTGTASPATGTIVLNLDGVEVPVNSEEHGSAFDLLPDSPLAFETPIPTVALTGWATALGIVEGVDVESNTDLRARLLDRIQNPITPFNAAEIRAILKTIPGITRVFVQESTPAAGQVTVYFMRDNDATPIPSVDEEAAALAKVITIKPAPTSEADVFVTGPTEVSQNFVLSVLTPDTPTMRTAVENQLAEFFKSQTDVGVDVTSEAYTSAVFNTVDQTTGAPVTAVTITTPAGDITVAAGEIATLGSVTFP